MSIYNIILLTSLFSLVIDQQCIFGKNCPYNQGFCIDTKCECIEGYWSLMDKSLLPEQQTFCNYKQTSLYIPLFLEFILPSLGHFYVGKYWFGLIKLFLLVLSFSTGAYLYGDIQVPSFITILKNQFVSDQPIFERKNMKEVLRGNKKTITLEDEISIGQKIIIVIFNICFYPFWILWASDLYFYFFKVYKDGNGVPFN